MKRTIVLSILCIAASVMTLTSSRGQAAEPGFIWLDNYASSGPRMTYLTLGYPPVLHYADSSFTVGLFYALGDLRASIPFDPGSGVPDGSLVLGTGPGSTAPIFDFPSGEGYFSATTPFAVPGSTPGQIITVEVIVYNGLDYASSLLRGHTEPFIMPTAVAITVPIPAVGDYMPVPEPSPFTLGAIAILVLSLLPAFRQAVRHG